jgi:hypothetical protein
VVWWGFIEVWWIEVEMVLDACIDQMEIWKVDEMDLKHGHVGMVQGEWWEFWVWYEGFAELDLSLKFGYLKICPKFTLDQISETIDGND